MCESKFAWFPHCAVNTLDYDKMIMLAFDSLVELQNWVNLLNGCLEKKIENL